MGWIHYQQLLQPLILSQVSLQWHHKTLQTVPVIAGVALLINNSFAVLTRQSESTRSVELFAPVTQVLTMELLPLWIRGSSSLGWSNQWRVELRQSYWSQVGISFPVDFNSFQLFTSIGWLGIQRISSSHHPRGRCRSSSHISESTWTGDSATRKQTRWSPEAENGREGTPSVNNLQLRHNNWGGVIDEDAEDAEWGTFD